MSIAISQGDYVYYQDTSTGAPTGWSWVFQGGSPTGSSSQNPVVQYLSPSGYYGYGTSLTATKSLLTSTKVDSTAIIVNPEALYLTVTANPILIPMSTQVTYTVAGPTASVAYYTWDLPGVTGFTGSNVDVTQNVTLDSWVLATGTEYGSTYSTYPVYATVYALSLLGNTDANNVLVEYSKNGPLQQINFGDPNNYSPVTVYYTPTIGITDTGSVGLPGSGWVLDIDCSGGELDNPYFRGQGESIFYTSSSMDIGGNYPFFADGIVYGQLVASAGGFLALGVPLTGWEVLDRYTAGQYMLPGDISTYFSNHLYFGDVSSALSGLTKPPRGWTPPQVLDLVFSTSVANQTSKSLELTALYLPQSSLFGLDGYNGASGGKGGCCLPAMGIAGGIVEIYIDIYYSPTGAIQDIDPMLTYTIPVTISDPSINGGMGNSPDQLLVLAQDTMNGSGIATLIQAQLDNYFVTTLGNPFNVYVQAGASPEYAYQYLFANYDVNVFNGLKLSVLSNNPLGAGPPYIAKVGLRDGFATSLAFPYNKTSAFGPGPGTGGIWTCFYYDYLANPYQNSIISHPVPVRGFSYYTPFY